ncbi:MAG: transcriptional repressor LexA [Pseudomonadota bacterium]|nr:transcriptional repressor LexA [Pseudomonadota bacterium]MEC7943327.1 transcriptional repressor LexA [Pseudomonadota bacterium]MEC8725963.1 transcriptional repressor LexA [Pseudomonadota bacterium]
MLTRKQHQLLTYIDNHMKSNGIPPSYDEMKDALSLKSKSGIHRLITGLEERGFLRRLPHKARALEILKEPQDLNSNPRKRGSFEPRIVDGSFNGVGKSTDKPLSENMVELPFYGKIAAGTPIEALRDRSRYFEVPPAMLGRDGDHYALEIEGDSMIDAGILDGDVVVIKRTDSAENGEIVVALVEGNEATLKRLRRRGASIALEPANPAHETRIFGPDQVSVQGRLVGLVRNY